MSNFQKMKRKCAVETKSKKGGDCSLLRATTRTTAEYSQLKEPRRNRRFHRRRRYSGLCILHLSIQELNSRAEYSAILTMFTAVSYALQFLSHTFLCSENFQYGVYLIFLILQLAIESPPSHVIVLGFLNGTLTSLKRDIARMFAVFYGRPNIDAVAR